MAQFSCEFINEQKKIKGQFAMISPRFAILHLLSVSNNEWTHNGQRKWHKTKLLITCIVKLIRKVVYEEYHSEFKHISDEMGQLNNFIDYSFFQGVAVVELKYDIDSSVIKRGKNVTGKDFGNIRRDYVLTQSNRNGGQDLSHQSLMGQLNESGQELKTALFSLPYHDINPVQEGQDKENQEFIQKHYYQMKGYKEEDFEDPPTKHHVQTQYKSSNLQEDQNRSG